MTAGLGRGWLTVATPFGDYIRKLRKDRTLTQTEAALVIGIPQTYLSALELGKKNNPSRDVLHGMARAYQVAYADLAALALEVGEAPATELPLDGLPPFLVALG